MPETVKVLEDKKIIWIDSYGDVTDKDLHHSLAEVERIHRETGFSRVFVDSSRETSLPSTFPLFRFGTELSQTIQNVKFAVVVSDSVSEDLQFLENVTTNRGMIVRMFNSTKDAMAWLTGESDTEE